MSDGLQFIACLLRIKSVKESERAGEASMPDLTDIIKSPHM
jgi:hypothetical protein